MHPDTPFCNRFGASTKWCEMTSNMILGPKLVVWMRSLRKNSKKFRHPKLLLYLHLDSPFCKRYARQPNGEKYV
jgi:hypothetical protein